MKNEGRNGNRSREQWIELRTATERIEGIIHMPPASKGRRIADFLLEADRGHCGMLHLSNATVFDVKTNRIKFYKPTLAINRSMVTYAAPLVAGEMMPKHSLDTPIAGVSAN